MNPEAEKLIPRDSCGIAFRNAMEGRRYGYEETLDAWYWFKDGWKAHK